MSDLITAAEAGDLDAIRAALDAGADIDAQDERGRTAVMAATYSHRTDAVRLLFERGADPDIRDELRNNPFLHAGAEGYLDILRLANAAGADPAIVNRYGGVALIPAAEHGYVDTVRYLLEETDIDVDHRNNLGWTALLEAIILNDGGPDQREVIRLLIEHGANVDLADGEGVMPLAHAQARGFGEIVAMLLAAGATRG